MPCFLSIPFSKSGPFPRPALPGVSSTTGLSRHPDGPGLVLADFRLVAWRTTDRASRVAAPSILQTCRRQYPGGNDPVRLSLASRTAVGLPLINGGSAPALPVSRPARRSLAFRPVCSLSRPRRPFGTRVLQSISLPPRTALAATNRSDNCWVGFAPTRMTRLSTAHVESGERARPALGVGEVAVCRRLSLCAGASVLTMATFPRPRSSNRTCGFPASGFPDETMPFAHGRPLVFGARLTRP